MVINTGKLLLCSEIFLGPCNNSANRSNTISNKIPSGAAPGGAGV